MRLNGKDLEQATAINEAISGSSDWPAGTYLVRWAVVADWMLPDGTRSLSCVAADGTTSWEINGLLRAGLQMDDWNDEESDDDEPD